MKPTLILSALLWFMSSQTQAQSDSLVTKDDSVYVKAEVMPEFPGGEQAFLKYMISIPYPQKAKEDDIQGMVVVKFIIDIDGKVINVEIAKSSGHKILDDAGIAHIQKMPVWKPGYQSGKPVKVEYAAPFKFYLL